MKQAISFEAGKFDYSSQLPISAYFDDGLFRWEQEKLFALGPRYLGHELMVPQQGDYHVLEMSDGSRYLKRAEDGVRAFSNICRHRQAIMLEGRGNEKNTTCPVHRWAYDAHGKLLGAPRFKDNPCLHLPETPLSRWQGMLFESGRDIEADLKDLGVAKDLDFSDYQFHRVEIEHYQGNWKTFIEVYLEDYHVDPFHPGLGHFVDCRNLDWQFGRWYSVQTVGINRERFKPGSDIYARWHQAVLARYGKQLPQFGAIWLTYYPNIMVEWYPLTLVISTVIPDGARSYRNIMEFYYPREILASSPEFIAAEQAAYRETAIEDANIIRRMEAGRAALYVAGRNEVGPYQSPMEDGMRHFHQYLRRELVGCL